MCESVANVTRNGSFLFLSRLEHTKGNIHWLMLCAEIGTVLSLVSLSIYMHAHARCLRNVQKKGNTYTGTVPKDSLTIVKNLRQRIVGECFGLKTRLENTV